MGVLRACVRAVVFYSIRNLDRHARIEEMDGRKGRARATCDGVHANNGFVRPISKISSYEEINCDDLRLAVEPRRSERS